MAKQLITLTEKQGDFIARKLMLMEARLTIAEAEITHLKECCKKVMGGDEPNGKAAFGRYIKLDMSANYSRFMELTQQEPNGKAAFGRYIKLDMSANYSRFMELTQQEPNGKAAFGRYIKLDMSANYSRFMELTQQEPNGKAAFGRYIKLDTSANYCRFIELEPQADTIDDTLSIVEDFNAYNNPYYAYTILLLPSEIEEDDSLVSIARYQDDKGGITADRINATIDNALPKNFKATARNWTSPNGNIYTAIVGLATSMSTQTMVAYFDANSNQRKAYEYVPKRLGSLNGTEVYIACSIIDREPPVTLSTPTSAQRWLSIQSFPYTYYYNINNGIYDKRTGEKAKTE